ncbi:MAG: hypothetical protein WCK48_03020, partial [bacterium]
MSFSIAMQVKAMSLAPYSDGPFIGGGAINTIASNASTTYVGGSFTYVANSGAPYGVILNRSDNSRATVYPAINGNVYTSLPDGNGGWYIGGAFTTVGGYNIPSLAHILSNGTVDTSWVPFSGTGSTVSALAISTSTNTIFVGGTFTSIGGQTRNNLAEVSLSTGLATSWDPNCNNSVNTLTISTSTIYVGGTFTNVGGQPRNRIAEIYRATALATYWNPSMSSTVNILVLSTSTIFAGGSFTSVGGVTRNRIAEISLITGSSTTWNPASSGTIKALALSSSSTIYVGGSFTTIGGQSRYRLAEISLFTGLATSWNPNSAQNAMIINVLLYATSTVYVGGKFDVVNGQQRSGLVEISASSGLPTTWNPGSVTSYSLGVSTLSLATSTIFAGGDFNSAGGNIDKPYLVAINNSTRSAVSSWSPNATGPIYSLALSSNNTLYAGGSFTSIGGQVRNNLAEVSLITGLATSWNPNVNDFVSSTVISSDGLTIFAGGNFTMVNGSGTANRNYLAAFNNTNGTMTSWNPNMNNIVNTLALSGSSIFVGGSFTTVGGATTRNNIAEISLSSGAATTWNPGLSGGNYVSSLALGASSIYVGGDFATVGGVARSGLAEISLATASSTSWNPNPVLNGGVGIGALVLNSSRIFVGGSFTSLAGQTIVNFAEVSVATGLPTTANMNPNPVNAFSLTPSLLFVGCNLNCNSNWTSLGYLAIFDASTYPSISFSSPTSSYSETSGL